MFLVNIYSFLDLPQDPGTLSHHVDPCSPACLVVQVCQEAPQCQAGLDFRQDLYCQIPLGYQSEQKASIKPGQ